MAGSPEAPENTESHETDGAHEPDEAPAPTPFDHPMFLPALLFAFALWFGYDGFLNTDPEMVEHSTFNRVGFALWVVLLAYYGIRGVREMREDAARSDDESTGPQH